MSRVTTSRGAALDARLAAERGRRLDRALSDAASGLDARDRAFAHELAYGTTRLRGRLDHLLGRHVRGGLDALDASVLEVLRLGAYQALYMGSVPTYAAVSESVDLVRAVTDGRPAGLVNAVLRRVGEDGDGVDLFPLLGDDPSTFLETWGSHPEWMVRRWLDRFGVERTCALVEASNRRPPIYLLPLGGPPDRAAEALRAAEIAVAGIEEEVGSVRLGEGADPVAALRVVPDAIIQDPGATMVARYADVPAGTKVADLCAAPGGKVLAAWNAPAFALASDRSEKRIDMVRDNVGRVGRDIAFAVADARRPPLSDMDVVMLDVPCTGTGTLARHPDARWRLRPESIGQMAEFQDELLAGAATAVAPGGLLVYSTCSLEHEENEQRVERFLERHAGFDLEPGPDGTDHLFVSPATHGHDGAFAARLRRAG